MTTQLPNSDSSAELSSEQTLQELIYAVTHDLGASVRAIKGFSDLLARRYSEPLDDDGRKFLRLLGKGAADLQTQLDALLTYSRVMTRGQPFEPIQVENVWQLAVSSVTGQIREAQALAEHGELPTVLADPNQLAFVLAELLENALKFRGTEPPRVRLYAERTNRLTTADARDDSEWTLRLSDNGCGIAPQNVTRVFRMFQRLRPEIPGIGAGLAIVQRIVQRHGGTIWAESTLGVGTSFCFTLPAAD